MKRLPPRPQKDAYRFTDEDLAADRDFQQSLVSLSADRDIKIMSTKAEVKSPLGPFVLPCVYQKGMGEPVILVSQPMPWDTALIKQFFSYVCRVRTTNEYMGMSILHAQKKTPPQEIQFLSHSSAEALLAVDARVFYKSDGTDEEINFSSQAEDFSKILQHHADFEVNFKPEMVGHLDRLIQSWYVDLNHDYSCLGALKNMIGFFYGEIFVRNGLGSWLARKCDGGFTSIWIETASCRYNVIGKVWKAFKYGVQEESLVELYSKAASEALAA